MRKIILTITCGILFSSCATIINGGKKNIRVDAKDLTGVTVSVNGIEKGTAPLTFKAKADDMITLDKQGYDSKTFNVDSKFNTIAILNLFSLIGWGIDLITESVKVPDTTVYSMTLTEKN